MPKPINRPAPSFSYFVVMRDFGRRGLEAVVDPEVTRCEVIARIASGEYDRVRFIHEVRDGEICDVTAEIMAELEAALSFEREAA